jgi:hypothetical protein
MILDVFNCGFSYEVGIWQPVWISTQLDFKSNGISNRGMLFTARIVAPSVKSKYENAYCRTRLSSNRTQPHDVQPFLKTNLEPLFYQVVQAMCNDLYFSPNIMRVIKSRRMRWAGYVARVGVRRGAHGVLVGKPDEKRPLGRPRRRWAYN